MYMTRLQPTNLYIQSINIRERVNSIISILIKVQNI